MIPLKIEYESTMYKLTHPDNLNELNPNQFRDVVRYFILPEQPLEERYSDQIMLLLSMLEKPINSVLKTKWVKAVDQMVKESILDDLIALQEFLYLEEDFTTWIFKSFKRKKINFVGPRDKFSFMTFGQFIIADTIFMGYFMNPSRQTLNKLVASLYVQDFKESYSTKDMDVREVLLRSISEIDKHGILYNYAGVRLWLTKKYPFVFDSDKKSGTSIVLGKSQKGWAAVRSNLAGSVLNLDKIDTALLHDVLSDFNKKLSQ